MRDVFHAAIRGRDQPLRRQVYQCGADAGGEGLGRLGLPVAHADDGEDHGLVAEAVEVREIEIGAGGFDRDLLDLRGGELGQERVNIGLVAVSRIANRVASSGATSSPGSSGCYRVKIPRPVLSVVPGLASPLGHHGLVTH